MTIVTIGGNQIEIQRARLRLWLRLTGIRESIEEAIKRQDTLEVSDLLVEYVTIASSIDCSDSPWYDVAGAFVEYQNCNSKTKRIPMLDTVSKEIPPFSWDYDGRLWYTWADMLAGKYGWTLEYIAEMDVDDAIALIQEIIVGDQLQREWEWQLSEVAYEYVKSSGSSRLRTLPRPDWMLKSAKQLKITTTKIPIDVLPVGMIENVSGMALHGRKETFVH